MAQNSFTKTEPLSSTSTPQPGANKPSVYGRRPTQTMSLSKVCESSSPPLVLYVTSTSRPLILVPVTLAPSRISSPCLEKIFLDSLAIALSMIAKKSSNASRRITSEPNLAQTEPNSRPITPAPITPRRFGTSSISNAPVESRIKSLSTGATGIEIGREPEASITF